MSILDAAPARSGAALEAENARLRADLALAHAERVTALDIMKLSDREIEVRLFAFMTECDELRAERDVALADVARLMAQRGELLLQALDIRAAIMASARALGEEGKTTS